MKIYNSIITAVVKVKATVKEYDNGDIEVIDLNEIEDLEEVIEIKYME